MKLTQVKMETEQVCLDTEEARCQNRSRSAVQNVQIEIKSCEKCKIRVHKGERVKKLG